MAEESKEEDGQELPVEGEDNPEKPKKKKV
jgi:hypothetical protein